MDDLFGQRPAAVASPPARDLVPVPRPGAAPPAPAGLGPMVESVLTCRGCNALTPGQPLLRDACRMGHTVRWVDGHGIGPNPAGTSPCAYAPRNQT